MPVHESHLIDNKKTERQTRESRGKSKVAVQPNNRRSENLSGTASAAVINIIPTTVPSPNFSGAAQSNYLLTAQARCSDSLPTEMLPVTSNVFRSITAT
jgi:hypothetical protein